MSRIARIKPADSIFHVMCRSISELNLFGDEDDKQYYLGLLKKYCDKFHCRIYAFCLMDTHLHLHFDPLGFDLSKFMLRVNTSYVLYYNGKYKRHGHLFQGRFESRVIANDNYNLAVSAYIHNNPKDIEGYKGREEEYPFSSYGIYLRKRKDTQGLLNTAFILGLFDAKDSEKAITRYGEFVKKQKDEATDKGIAKCLEKFASNEYKSERRVIFRNFGISDIITTIAEKMGVHTKNAIHLKYNRTASDFRAYCSFILSSLCGISHKELCHLIGNITQSGVSGLCKRGFRLFSEKEEYRGLFEEIILSA